MNDDARVVREIAAVSDGDVPHVIHHYLYTPTREAAGQVAKVLRQRGFDVEERLGGDGVNWLVLGHHEVVPTEQLMTSLRHSLEALASEVGGEYDGWEADVRHRVPTSH
ncbi:MAG: ribonuclease E inhibitor RraB [Hyphomicrobium sp.]|jgi:hypothetical protein